MMITVHEKLPTQGGDKSNLQTVYGKLQSELLEDLKIITSQQSTIPCEQNNYGIGHSWGV